MLGARWWRLRTIFGQEPVAECGGEPDRDAAALPARDAPRRGGRLVGEAQDARRLREERLARGGEAHDAVRAREERRSDLMLQQPDLPAERRLRHVEPFGSAAEMELLTDGDEAAKLAYLEHDSTPVSIKSLIDLIVNQSAMKIEVIRKTDGRRQRTGGSLDTNT